MRVDMVERVAALVRAAARSGEFGITDEMLSLAGVGRDIMASMIVGLGFEKVREEPAEDPEKPAIPVFIKKQRQNNRRMSNAKSGESAGRQQNQNKKGGAQSQKPFKRNNNQKGSHQKANHQKAANKASKPVDVNPHSPFAILANLKK
jgi:ATP-dependent RNA helicase SUPV3L1/SUV3